MKDFTTAEYVNPVLEWYRTKYHPITDKTVLDALHCDLVLQRNDNRYTVTVRRGDLFYTYDYPFQQVEREIDKYAEQYAELLSTEYGDLEDWVVSEKLRFAFAIRDALIKEYLGL